MGVIELILTGVGLSMDAFAVAVCKGLGMRRVNWGHAFVIALFFGGFQALMPLVGWAAGSLFASSIKAVDHWIAFGLLSFIGGKMLWDAFREGSGDAETCACGRDCSTCLKYRTPVCEHREEADEPGARSGRSAAATDAAGTRDATVRDAAVARGMWPACEHPEGASDPAASRPPAKDALDYRELVMLAVATSIDALVVGVTFAFLGVNIWLAIAVIGIITFALSFAGVAIGNQFGARFERPATIAGGIVLILLGVKTLIEHLCG